jgi:hypothetical protein
MIPKLVSASTKTFIAITNKHSLFFLDFGDNSKKVSEETTPRILVLTLYNCLS